MSGAPAPDTARAAAAPPTPAPTTGGALFSDGFESGSFSAWSLVKAGGGGTATVQGSVVKTGAYAARLSESAAAGSYAYARKTLPSAHTDLDVAADIDLTAEGPSGGNIPLLRLFDPSLARIVNVYRSNASDMVWVGHSGAYDPTSGTFPLDRWEHVEVHAITAGAGASTVQVWLNGTLIYQTSRASLGTAGVLKVQIGNEIASQPFTQAVDNVVVTNGQ